MDQFPQSLFQFWAYFIFPTYKKLWFSKKDCLDKKHCTKTFWRTDHLEPIIVSATCNNQRFDNIEKNPVVCVNVKWRQFELDVWTFASSTTKLWNWFPALLLRSLESCQNPNMLMSCESRVQTTPTSHDRFTIWFELVVSFRTIISGAKVYFDAMRFFPSSCWQT